MARTPGSTREATRAAIIEAAERVFTENGFAAGSLTEIAKEAGITKSLIHYHFGTKQELWQEIKEVHFKDLASRLAGIFASQSPAEDFFRESFSAYFEFLRQNPQFLRLMWWRQAEQGGGNASQHATEAIRLLAGRGIDRLRELQDDGFLRDDLEPRFILSIYLSLVRHWFTTRRDFGLVGEDEVDEEVDLAYLDTALKVFFEGVVSRPETPGGKA